MKTAAISMETDSASGLADGASDGATKTALKLQYLKVDGCFLWYSNPGLQQFAAFAFQPSVSTNCARFPRVTDSKNCSRSKTKPERYGSSITR